MGNLNYKANYFYGKQIGPIFTYSGSKIIEYSFNNFEDNILYYYSYDTINEKEFYANEKFLIKASTSEIIQDGKDGIKVFLYIFNPPQLRLNYKICYFDLGNRIIDSFVVPTNDFYYEHFFEKPKTNCNLGILLNKFDSSLKKESVILEYLKSSYP